MVKKQSNTEGALQTEGSPILLPAILARSGRHPFRKAFIKVYPFFIHCLRNAVPNITEGEEILCMLLYLKQNTNDIAAVLGIARKSVNQTRFRLRQKIDIPSHTTLEEFVLQLSAEPNHRP